MILGDRGGAASAARSGRHRGRAQGLPRGARGDHDDHAQLDRDLHDAVLLRGRRAAARTTRSATASRRTSSLGAVPRACGASSSSIHIGIFIALGCAVVYYVILNRTTLGYEVRAVGFNPEAARYGGISVKRSMIASMAICGAFAGLAGAIQVLGVQLLDRLLGRARARHRLHRHRGRAARAQHRRRRRALGAPVRGAAERRARSSRARSRPSSRAALRASSRARSSCSSAAS